MLRHRRPPPHITGETNVAAVVMGAAINGRYSTGSVSGPTVLQRSNSAVTGGTVMGTTCG
jgi:hypothetical protein